MELMIIHCSDKERKKGGSSSHGVTLIREKTSIKIYTPILRKQASDINI